MLHTHSAGLNMCRENSKNNDRDTTTHSFTTGRQGWIAPFALRIIQDTFQAQALCGCRHQETVS
eukprot:scaffold4855_cov195-Amphora_coffeaeformis.AAC.21